MKVLAIIFAVALAFDGVVLTLYGVVNPEQSAQDAFRAELPLQKFGEQWKLGH
jgi:hypothetical protein